MAFGGSDGCRGPCDRIIDDCVYRGGGNAARNRNVNDLVQARNLGWYTIDLAFDVDFPDQVSFVFKRRFVLIYLFLLLFGLLFELR